MKKICLVVIFLIVGLFAAYKILPLKPIESLPTSRIESSPTLKPQNTLLTVSSPKRIRIPKLNVEAPVEQVAKDKLGRMDVPKNYFNAGWYRLGSKPGEPGSAVIDGHVDTPQGLPSIFAKIDTLVAGDEIIIVDSKNNEYTFTVVEGVNYPLASIPLENIFDQKTSEKRLNLITCSGEWDKSRKMYTDRFVVYAVMK